MILRFIRELAIYEKAESSVQSDEAGIVASLCGEGAKARALICEAGGEAIGYAVSFYNYSTWLGRNGVYLEDLYVSP
ncbi:N-acetyltransferase family protein, partial [Stenotrophomonas sp. SrG]|uniref:GNAT family N-acetyltransferase n=1 Tax=Stenotrophomonas sp. SrG TaxID=3414430 RepID=UPI003CF86359